MRVSYVKKRQSVRGAKCRGGRVLTMSGVKKARCQACQVSERPRCPMSRKQGVHGIHCQRRQRAASYFAKVDKVSRLPIVKGSKVSSVHVLYETVCHGSLAKEARRQVSESKMFSVSSVQGVQDLVAQDLDRLSAGLCSTCV